MTAASHTAPISRRDALLLLTGSLVAMACGDAPRALVPGTDSCARCRMTIDDVRFGALVRTAKGKLLTFDSIECVAAYVASLGTDSSPETVWVADFAMPNRWVEATGARYLHGSALRSPMGRDLAAFGADTNPAALVAAHGGTALTWPEVVALTARPLSAPGTSDNAEPGHAR